MYEYEALLLRVIDGDTIHIMVDLGMDVEVSCKCRLWGINAPEMNTDAGKEAKKHLESLLPIASRLIVHTFKDRREKYGRYLVRVSRKDDTSPFTANDRMVQAGHAVRYMDT